MELHGQLLVFLMVVAMFGIVARASSLDSHSNFINSLQDYMKYDKRLRPYDREDTLNVTISMTIFSFGEIDAIDGEFGLDVFFYQSWRDPRLIHNYTGPVILIGTYTNLIWLPDTYFINIKTAKVNDVPSITSDVRIKQNGEVWYSKRITLTAGCEIDLHRYPLDSQICNLRIMSYAYNTDELDYHWKGDKNEDITVMNDHMPQLIVTDVQKLKTNSEFRGVPFSELVAVFEFKRRLGYSFLQVYAPTFLIVALSWLSFWISKNAVPARVALGVTTLLTIVTLNGSLRSAVPKVSYIKALDLYLIVSFLFVFGAVLEYIAVLLHHDFAAHHKDEKKTQDEQVIKEVSDNIQMRSVQKVEERGSSNSIEISETSKQSTSSRSKRNHEKAVEFINAIISVNSAPIDRISKFAFPLCYILFNILYWIIYSV